MAFLSRIRTQILSWWQDTPLPAGTSATFQSWHEFDELGNRWGAVEMAPRERPATSPPPDDRDNTGSHQRATATDDDDDDGPHNLNLVTWNVDYSSPHPAQRLSAILARTLSLSPAVDIIFLQEVSRAAFARLLEEREVRRAWFLSGADDAVFPAGQSSVTTVTLLSKARFSQSSSSSSPTSKKNPGPVWRVKYPSRFGRDALCCDIFVPAAAPSSSSSSTAQDGPGGGGVPVRRLRLINVHLDSLPIQPSLRPQQVAVAAALLRSAGRVVALVRENGLVDAWGKVRPGEDGFTWGVDGREPFPPCRMDRVAVVGVGVGGVEVLAPGYIPVGEVDGDEAVAWSDHSGVRCSFKLVGP
ncbi:hypothetical protein C8A01DRAFT_49617 [Parachaetomium inaequale]|uniref:Endonuclease/exonuclease/phosphatase domain-containing protein n=1 Tax=Parachaetomium inaequale TaxID=2588326 RepID=A0AAN6SNJ3_9PEZI|nr:hypothetical protein C8A01DRAFT_49617 [Parachaetomium inaequale]